MIGHFFTTSHTERLRPFGGGRDAGVQHGDGLEHLADHHLVSPATRKPFVSSERYGPAYPRR